MTVRMTEMETLLTSWKSAEHVLRNWGHEPEAEIVAVCRDALGEQLTRKGQMRPSALLRVWADDAAALETYGHGDQAESLRRCCGQLQALLEPEEGSSETPSPSTRRARFRRRENASGGNEGDGRKPAAEASEREAAPKPEGWPT